MKKKGFTLVEILIVIAISGILMAMSAPKYGGMVQTAERLKEKSEDREIVMLVDFYNAEYSPDIPETAKMSEVALMPNISDDLEAILGARSAADAAFSDKLVSTLRSELSTP